MKPNGIALLDEAAHGRLCRDPYRIVPEVPRVDVALSAHIECHSCVV